MIVDDLPGVLQRFARMPGDSNFLVVSRTEPESPLEQYFPGDSSVEWLCHVDSADDLVAVSRADLTIVFDQLEHMERTRGAQVLGQLRDRYSKRVLLHCRIPVYSNQELLALGFIEQEHSAAAGRFYLFDADLYFERREWNTPDKWANPENFKKYRW